MILNNHSLEFREHRESARCFFEVIIRDQTTNQAQALLSSAFKTNGSNGSNGSNGHDPERNHVLNELFITLGGVLRQRLFPEDSLDYHKQPYRWRTGQLVSSTNPKE